MAERAVFVPGVAWERGDDARLRLVCLACNGQVAGSGLWSLTGCVYTLICARCGALYCESAAERGGAE